MWSDLVQAYESKLQVLEEARAAYSEAVGQVVNQSAPAIKDAVLEGLGDEASRLRVEAVVAESGSNATFASAPWSYITIADDEVGTEFRVAVWVGSSWGGPAGVLRVVLSLERVHSGLDRREWVAKCSASIAESVPGEAFEPLDGQRFGDLSSDWPVVRVASVELAGLDSRQAGLEACQVAHSLSESILSMLKSIRDAGLALSLAESALLRYRPTLEARAGQVGAPVYPSRGLGPWQGGRYLQVGSFWLVTNPDTNELLAAAKNDEDAVLNLAQELGGQMSRRGGRLAVVLMSEAQLRGSECEVDRLVARAYDVWFETTAHELAADGEDEPG